MSKFKQQFSQLRQTTPKRVQWLLMAAAFVVVLILLTLIISGHKKSDEKIDVKDNAVKLTITPSEILKWADIALGETKVQEYTITSTVPTKIVAVRPSEKVAGFTMLETCSNQSVDITPTLPCNITITFKPVSAMPPTNLTIFIDYHGADQTDVMKKTDEIKIVLGAANNTGSAFIDDAPAKKDADPEPVPDPEPVSAPTPAPEPEPEPVPSPEPAPATNPEPAPVSVPDTIQDEIRTDIELISPSDPFADAPKTTKTVDNSKQDIPTADACSDFAFPGYDASGRQIGWIKPEHGAYYFHPFSDKNCDTPTGVYNPDNGIITDIDNSSKKIGTDAEHIGYSAGVANGALPSLTSRVGAAKNDGGAPVINGMSRNGILISTDESDPGFKFTEQVKDVKYESSGTTVKNTIAYDRTMILRQYKPIPATIVSDVRADPSIYKLGEQNSLPVTATVDRNVYSDNGRTVIIPAGTLMLGYLTGTMPGPYTTIGRMEIKWYQFVLPNGVEFNFSGNGADPFSGDSQGRVGVPGRGSTDYLEQFVMPMLTAIVPAAVNMISPIADKFVNQIDLDNNTVVQSGTVRSSELAKNEIITAWNQVAQKLLVDMMDNTTPPFTIPAGTRITVYSPADLQVVCGMPGAEGVSEKCAVGYAEDKRATWAHKAEPVYGDGTWTGQSRSFDMQKFCIQNNNGIWDIDSNQTGDIYSSGYSYATVLGYCKSLNYVAINNARQDALYNNQHQQFTNTYEPVATTGGVGAGTDNLSVLGNAAYNEQILGLQYADEEKTQIVNPFQQQPQEEAPAAITCIDGTPPDANGCCTGEVYTDMGAQGMNCCPETGGDCFPPIVVE